MRRPIVALVASGCLLALIAVPALSLKTNSGALDQFPAGHEAHTGFAAAAKQAGPGAMTPVNVVVRPSAGSGQPPSTAELRGLRSAIARDRAVARVAAPIAARDGQSALLAATPRADGERPATKELVQRLRDQLPASAPGLRVEVGGPPAGIADFNDLVSGSMWKIALFVLALSYVVLLVLLRSVLLPLKAVLMNLLSVGAGYGVIVAVFQWGWVDGLFGFQSLGYVDTVTPPLVLAVVFGLSMDYEIFLLSRIRERFSATATATRSRPSPAAWPAARARSRARR